MYKKIINEMNHVENIEAALEQLKAIVDSNNYIDDALKIDSYLYDWRNQFHGFQFRSPNRPNAAY